MPDNVLLTPKVMARLNLFSLGNRLVVAKNMCRQIMPDFAKKAMKIGDTIQVRKPYRFIGGEGLTFDPEPLVDQVTPIVVNKVPHVHYMYDSVEKTLELREALNIYGDPSAIAMASKFNRLAAQFAADNALMSVGTPGVAPNSEVTYLAALDRLVELGLPENEPVNLFINRRMSSAYVSGQKALFNPQGLIGGQLSQGMMATQLGYAKVMLDQTINRHTNGTWTVVGLANAAAGQQADGGNNATMTLVTDTWTTGALKAGDRFIIGSATSATEGGVNAVYPQTRESFGQQQVFTVMQDVSDAGGAMSIVISPAVTPSGQYQNVDSAVVDNAIITMIGTTGQTFTQGLAMHENSFAIVSVPMAVPDDGEGAVVAQETDSEGTGLTIRYSRFWDGNASTHKHRYDALTGVGSLYKEMAVAVCA